MHDPYPIDEAGPAIVGARPLSYPQQMTEVERARFYNPPSQVLRPLPTFAPTVVTPQVAPTPWLPPPAQQPPLPPYPPPPAFQPPGYQYP